MDFGDRPGAGFHLRRQLLADAGIHLEGDLGLGGQRVGVDDVLDAAVVAWSPGRLVAWSARRVLRGAALSLPDPPVGKATASKWLKTHHPDLVPVRSERGGAHKFGYYMDVVGWDVPPEFGDGVVGSNLKLLREALERGKTWETLAEGQRIAWWRILGHKMHDCLGMREVVMIAAEGLT